MKQHQREQTCGFSRSIRLHQLAQQATETNSFRTEIRSNQIVSRRRAVAFREHQIDDIQNNIEALRHPRTVRDLVRDPRLLDLSFCAYDSLRNSRLRHKERSRDVGRSQTAE